MAGAENSVVMYLALKRANVPAELHVYAQGGHGFGVRKSACPVRPGRIAVSPGCKTRACSARRLTK